VAAPEQVNLKELQMILWKWASIFICSFQSGHLDSSDDSIDFPDFIAADDPGSHNGALIQEPGYSGFAAYKRSD
jgi:hypothetical protein